MGSNDIPVRSSLGNLREEIDRLTEGNVIRSKFKALRDTCGFTDDELITFAAMLGAEFAGPEQLNGFHTVWPANKPRGRGMISSTAATCAWRFLWEYQPQILEDEYNARQNAKGVDQGPAEVGRNE